MDGESKSLGKQQGQAKKEVSVLDPNEVRRWAARINAAWLKTLEAIMETGKTLIAAKEGLRHGEWHRLISERHLRFRRETAFKLMKIAAHPVLSNVAHAQRLPPAWTTLYELTAFPDAVLLRYLEDGTIHPEITREEVVALKWRLLKRDQNTRGLQSTVGLPARDVVRFTEAALVSQGEARTVTTELLRDLSEPLVIEDGKIKSGVLWVEGDANSGPLPQRPANAPLGVRSPTPRSTDKR